MVISGEETTRFESEIARPIVLDPKSRPKTRLSLISNFLKLSGSIIGIIYYIRLV